MNKVFRLNLLTLAGLVWVIGILGWLLIRQPAIRSSITQIAHHRPDTSEAYVRQILAPRSLFFSAFVIAAVAVALTTFPRTRQRMLTSLSARDGITGLLVQVQCLIAIAVVINLHAYIHRQLGQPLWRLSGDEVAEFAVGGAWKHSERLLKDLPPTARVAMKSNDPFVYQIVAGLIYPIALYEMHPKDMNNWRADSDFAEFAAKRGITHLMEYNPNDPVQPIRLKLLQ